MKHIIIDNQLINVEEIVNIKKELRFPKIEAIYACIVIYFKNGTNTELFTIKGKYLGRDAGMEAHIAQKIELLELVGKSLKITLIAIHLNHNIDSNGEELDKYYDNIK